jgi:N-acetylneuraminic acid mutarotase
LTKTLKTKPKLKGLGGVMNKKYYLFLTFTLVIIIGASFFLNAEAVLADNTWEILSPIPLQVATSIEFTKIKAITVNDQIFIFHKTSTHSYNPQTNTWANRTAMPTPKGYYFGVAAVGTTIYTIGEGVNEAYDTLTDTWETKQPPPQALTYMNGVHAVEGKIYCLNGWVYDPKTDSWATINAPPSHPYHFSIALDNKIYTFVDRYSGVFIESELRSDIGKIYVYDTKTDHWTTGASLPEVYFGSGIAATSGQYAPKRIYVIGGCIVHGLALQRVVNQTYAYNPETDSWERVADMPTARNNFATAVVKDKIYAMGGHLDMNGFISNQTGAVEVYTPSGYNNIASPSSPTSSQPINTATNPPFLTQNTILIAGVVIAAAGIVIYHFKRAQLN